MRRKYQLAIVTGVIIIGLFWAFSVKSNSKPAPLPQTKPEIGFSAPDFTLKSLDGKTVKLSDFKGKPVYINFWASWCPPCKKEIPEIQKFYTQNKGQVVVLAINITFDDKLADVQNILKKNNATFPVLLDESQDNAVADLYQVYGIPASFFIDKDGIIRDHHIGGMTFDMLQASIQKAM